MLIHGTAKNMAKLNPSAPIFIAPPLFEKVFSSSADDRVAKEIKEVLLDLEKVGCASKIGDLYIHFLCYESSNGQEIVLITDCYIIVPKHFEEVHETAIPFHVV